MPDLTTDGLARLRAIAEECVKAFANYARAAEAYRRAEGSTAIKAAREDADAAALRQREAKSEFLLRIDPATALALLDEIERLRRQLKPSEPSGLMAALCADVQRARTSHRNPQLPQEPPSHG